MAIEWWTFTGLRHRGGLSSGYFSSFGRRLHSYLDWLVATGTALDIKYSATRQLQVIFVCFDVPMGRDAEKRRAELVELLAPSWYNHAKRMTDV